MAASDGSLASATMRAEPAVSASGTGLKPSSISLRRHCPSACVWLRTRLTVCKRCAGRRHQLVAHAQEVLPDDVEIGVGQQVMDVGDAAGDRVLDGDHGEARFARLHRLQARPRTSGRRPRPCRERLRGRPGENWRPARPDRRCAQRRIWSSWHHALGAVRAGCGHQQRKRWSRSMPVPARDRKSSGLARARRARRWYRCD